MLERLLRLSRDRTGQRTHMFKGSGDAVFIHAVASHHSGSKFKAPDGREAWGVLFFAKYIACANLKI